MNNKLYLVGNYDDYDNYFVVIAENVESARAKIIANLASRITEEGEKPVSSYAHWTPNSHIRDNIKFYEKTDKFKLIGDGVYETENA